jgi:hypothetical protein
VLSITIINVRASLTDDSRVEVGRAYICRAQAFAGFSKSIFELTWGSKSSLVRISLSLSLSLSLPLYLSISLSSLSISLSLLSISSLYLSLYTPKVLSLSGMMDLKWNPSGLGLNSGCSGLGPTHLYSRVIIYDSKMFIAPAFGLM